MKPPGCPQSLPADLSTIPFKLKGWCLSLTEVMFVQPIFALVCKESFQFPYHAHRSESFPAFAPLTASRCVESSFPVYSVYRFITRWDDFPLNPSATLLGFFFSFLNSSGSCWRLLRQTILFSDKVPVFLRTIIFRCFEQIVYWNIFFFKKNLMTFNQPPTQIFCYFSHYKAVRFWWNLRCRENYNEFTWFDRANTIRSGDTWIHKLIN